MTYSILKFKPHFREATYSERLRGVKEIEHAICRQCGEVHYVNKNGFIQVNGHIITSCINCTYQRTGIKYWQ